MTPLQTPELHARLETHLTRSSRLSWPTRGSLLLYLRNWWLSQSFESTSFRLVGAGARFRISVIAPQFHPKCCVLSLQGADLLLQCSHASSKLRSSGIARQSQGFKRVSRCRLTLNQQRTRTPFSQYNRQKTRNVLFSRAPPNNKGHADSATLRCHDCRVSVISAHYDY